MSEVGSNSKRYCTNIALFSFLSAKMSFKKCIQCVLNKEGSAHLLFPCN